MVTYVPTNSPEVRSDIIAEVIRQVARMPGPAKLGAVFDSVLKALGRPEEDIGFDLRASIFLLLRAGLIKSNTFDGFEMRSRSISTLTASEDLTTYIFHETSGYWTEDGDPEGGAV
ncbi:MAG: hypothetical protein ABII76_27230 [Pseudomonadota bacterium]